MKTRLFTLVLAVAVSIGTVFAEIIERLQLSDFIGNIPGLYVNSEGVLSLRSVFPDSRDFHKFDMRQHGGEQNDTLNVYQKMDAIGLIGPGGVIKGTGMGFDIPFTLYFDYPIKLKDINTEIRRERIDSVLIEMARFSSQFNRADLPLEWEWIDQVDLVLGDQVYRPAGNTQVIYRKGDVGGYDVPFNTDIDNFSISLMKDKNLSIERDNFFEYAANVDSIFTVGVDFKFTIPKEAGPITLLPTSKFTYNMQVEFIDYSAIWGYFSPDKDMISKRVEVDIDTIFGDLTRSNRLSLPFTDPTIDVAVTTSIAGAMTLTGNYIYVLDQNGDSTFAMFNNYRNFVFPMNPWLHPDPKKSAISASVTDTLHFGKDWGEGQIDKLFGKIPQKLGYDFYVDINSYKSPQMRITPNTQVDIDVICDLPFKFRDGLLIDINDTIQDLEHGIVNIDSLIHEYLIFDTTNVSELTLGITAENEIPLSIKAVLTYLDNNDQPIKDPTDPSKFFNPFLEDTLRIAPPRFAKNYMGQWAPVENGKTIFTAYMNKERLNAVRDIKKIVYQLIVDNEALNYAFKSNPGLQEIRLTKDQHVEFSIQTLQCVTASGTCGANLTWELNCDSVLTISGTGEMTSGSPWSVYRESITSAIIDNGVTSIGNSAFYECTSLTSITFPNNVTSIGNAAFYGCSSMTSITLPNSITSIGNAAFYGCNNLTSVTCEAVTPPTLGERVFQEVDCSTIPLYVPAKSIEAYQAADQWKDFNVLTCIAASGICGANGDNLIWELSCDSILTISGMGEMASGSPWSSYCTDIISVTIPNSVTTIGEGAFAYCQNLTSVTIPNSVTSIGGSTFRGCTGLTSVTIPNSVTNIGEYSFYGCAIENLILGTSVKVIDRGAFAYNYVRDENGNPDYNTPSIKTITCYSMRPPTVQWENNTNRSFPENQPYSTIIYVPADYLTYYQVHDFWGLFDVRPIGAATTETTEVKVEPTETAVSVAWPSVTGAATYELVIVDKEGKTICTLIFNAQGLLTQIAFNAPSRNGAPQKEQTAGFSFTVTGLEMGTSYDLTITAKNEDGQELDKKNVSFHTDWSQDIDDLHVDSDKPVKVLMDGQIFIHRGDHIFDTQGKLIK